MIEGILIGLGIASLIFITELHFDIRKISVIDKIDEAITKADSPKKKAYVIEPESDEEEAQKRIIKINEKARRDTKLEDL